ncbi:hepatocyte growth factor receptor-like [Glandiceps talaboti]
MKMYFSKLVGLLCCLAVFSPGLAREWVEMSDEIGGILSHFVVHKQTGDVYLAIRALCDHEYDDPGTLHHLNISSLYKLNENLDIVVSVEVPNAVNLLLIDYKQEILVVCEVIGQCFPHNMETLSRLPSHQEPNVVSTKRFMLTSCTPSGWDTVAFIGGKNDDTLYTASPAKNTQSGETARMASRQLSIGDNFLKLLRNDSTLSKSAAYLSDVVSNKHFIQPETIVYGFSHNGFSYFIGTFFLDNQTKLGRIIRVCQLDTDFSSYMEVSLQCVIGPEDTNTSRIVYGKSVTWGYLTTVSPFVAATFGFNDDEMVLYYVVASAYLCVIKMSDVEAVFEDNIESCLKGGNLTTMAPELRNIQCSPKETYSTSDFLCGGLRNITGGIGGKGGTIPVTGVAIQKLSYGFMGIVVDNGKQSIIIHGHSTYKKSYQTEIVQRNMTIPVAEPNPNQCPGRYEFFHLHPDKKHIFRFHSVFSDSNRNFRPTTTITKGVLGNCELYNDNCTACLKSNPLCGWCSQVNKCTLESECFGVKWTEAWSKSNKNGNDTDWLITICSDKGEDLNDYNVKVSPKSGIRGHQTTTVITIATTSPPTAVNNVNVYVEVLIDAYQLCKNVKPVSCNISQFVDGDQTSLNDSTQLEPETVSYPVQCSYLVRCSVSTIPEKLEGPVIVKLHFLQTPYTRVMMNSTVNFTFNRPSINSFSPTKGPQSGGTLLQIRGDNLLSFKSISVIVAGLKCQLKTDEARDDYLVCITSRAETLPLKSAISINYDEYYTASSTQYYTYTEDPVIYSIYPLRTFQAGGSLQYVTGTNLDSVAKPLFVVNMVVGNDIKGHWTSICKVSNASLMTCPTPEVSISDTVDLNRVKRNSDENENKGKGDADDLGCNYITSTSSGDKSMSRGNTFTVNVGFIMDGVKAWLPKFIDEHLDKQYTTLMVSEDPVYYHFPGINNILTFDPSEEYLIIKGERLDCGAVITDIIVEIGTAFCEPIVFLNSSQLTCKPPEEQPSVKTKYDAGLDLPHVLVRLGKEMEESGKSSDYFIGYLEYQYSILATAPSTEYTTSIIVAVVSVIGSLSLVTIVVIVIVCRKRRNRDKESDTQLVQIRNTTCGDEQVTSMEPRYQELVRYHTPGEVAEFQMFLSPECYKDPISHTRSKSQIFEWLDEDLRIVIQDVLIDNKKLTFNNTEILGKGAFGTVILGELQDNVDGVKRQVAVKSLKRNTEVKDICRFLEEGILMKDFNHINVLSLIGVCIDETSNPLIVLPYMKNGDLKSHVSDSKRVLMVANLIMYALHVARGMEYLASLKFVHRDLAARNCMVDESETVKVSDFGLSRDIYEKEYYASEDKKAKLPIRWMSPESIKRSMYNTKTDMWSFGVLFWELLTRGELPYGSVDNWDIPKYLENGRRLPQPGYVSDKLYKLLCDCWDDDPRKRPDFTPMVIQLQDLLKSNVSSNEGRTEYYNTAVNSPCYLNLLEE